jgi:two-component system, sensor histidine kinase YesM
MKHISFRTRLFIYSLVFTVLSLTGLTLSIQIQTKLYLIKQAKESIPSQFDLFANNLQQSIDTISDIGQKIYYNDDIMNILSQNHPYIDSYLLTTDSNAASPVYNSTTILNEMRLISGILDNYKFSYILNTPIYPTLYMINRPEYANYTSYPYVEDHRVIEKEAWYLPLTSNDNYALIHNISDSRLYSDYVMRYAKRLYGLNRTGIPYAALLTIDFDIEPLCRLLDTLKMTKNTRLMVIDGKNDILFSNYLDLVNTSVMNEPYYSYIPSGMEGLFYCDINSKSYFAYYKPISFQDWSLLTLIPVDELTKGSHDLAATQWLFLCIGIIFSFIISLSFTHDMARPINSLVSSMKIASKGEFNLQLDYKYDDEFQYLIQQYNDMMNKIHYLVDTLYKTELDKKTAELNALQAQINPHFLYNTLDCILLMAQKGDIKVVSDLVLALSNFYRFSLSRGKTFITFAEEQRQIESYLVIQKLKYKDRLNYKISLDSKTLRFYMIKLLLQPLVENALIHGIELLPNDVIGTISISSKLYDGFIVLEVIDNGVGCDVDRLNEELMRNTTSKSFGVRNVYHRIMNHFGPDFGIQYSKNEPQGTKVTLRLPIIRFMEVNDV